jgi:hypothetical protein
MELGGGGEQKPKEDPNGERTVDLDLTKHPFLVEAGREEKDRSPKTERVAVGAVSLNKEQEKVRGRLAQWLTAGALVLILFFAISVAADWMRPEEVKTLAAVILSPLIGLAGSAAGFYFGQRSS